MFYRYDDNIFFNSIVVQVTKPPSKLDKLMKDSFLNKIRIKVMKKLKEVSVNVTSETRKGTEGSSITLFCPGATIDMRVKWKYKERPLKADRLKERTLGRMTIDATDALHINELRVTDAGEYTCTLYDVEIVISRHAVFDPTTNFGILTLTLLFSFLLWIVLMSVRWKNFRMQRRVQQMRNRRKELPEEETEDTESLLSLVNEEASLTTRTERDT
ncbi:ig-like domain-containing protein [Trichonephila clavata]|uniref:Ig-like domain-containing protein n=1 Tax=Trichonephila clavata TaxID=2740835 RepID=A0A8X6LMB6_TRICU|nr:ig-like domain-containing protein [Trichonephila clavata]